MRTLGDRLREAREAADVLLTELSSLAGLGPSHVGMIERGHPADPRLSTIVKLATITGLSLDWLILGRGAPMAPKEREDGAEAHPRARDIIAAVQRYRETQQQKKDRAA